MCKELLQLAEAGQVSGLVFAAKFGRKIHHTGIAGDYARNPDEALAATQKMQGRLLEEQEALQEDCGT